MDPTYSYDESSDTDNTNPINEEDIPEGRVILEAEDLVKSAVIGQSDVSSIFEKQKVSSPVVKHNKKSEWDHEINIELTDQSEPTSMVIPKDMMSSLQRGW